MKEIKLSRGKTAIVDDEYYEWLNQWKWHINSCGYACRTVQHSTSILMHRLINKTPPGVETDHINHNKLDNRHENLRICTRSQNVANTDIRHTNTSGYKGVCWNKAQHKWRSSIGFNSKRIHIGYYADIEEAVNAYQNKARELFGEFAS